LTLASSALSAHQSAPDGWWAHNAGSTFVGAAAVVAAALAAFVATRNHREQLKHDREMRDRAHIRDTLDAALQGLNKAIEASALAGASLTVRESYFQAKWAEEEDPEQSKKRWRKTATTDMEKAFKTELTMRANQVRIEIRLGTDHPIAVRHSAVMEELIAINERVGKALVVPRLDDPEEAAKVTDHKEAGRRFTALRRACLDWFGS